MKESPPSLQESAVADSAHWDWWDGWQGVQQQVEPEPITGSGLLKPSKRYESQVKVGLGLLRWTWETWVQIQSQGDLGPITASQPSLPHRVVVERIEAGLENHTGHLILSFKVS